MTAPTITAEDMKAKGKLLTLDEVRERLEPTEVLAAVTFALDGTAKFTLPNGWNVGLAEREGIELTDATVTIDNVERRMTKDALLAFTSSIGITREYVAKTPGDLMETHVNYWAKMLPSKSMKLMVGPGKNGAAGNVLATTKATITPFSNMALLDTAIAGIRSKYGQDAEILADYKFHNDLRRTAYRLIVPDYARHITSERDGDTVDSWSTGVQVYNSLVGEKPTSLSGYLFAWWCTNGAISTHASSGNYNRRTQGGTQDELLEWAQASVDEILGGLEHEFDAIEELTTVKLGDDVSGTLTDIFTMYKVPVAMREQIILSLVESEDNSMYGVMNAITQAANGDGVHDHVRQTLMEIGGNLPAATTGRCAACKRLALTH